MSIVTPSVASMQSQKVNVLGNAHRSGINLSRVINSAASVRNAHNFNSKNRIDMSMRNYLTD